MSGIAAAVFTGLCICALTLAGCARPAPPKPVPPITLDAQPTPQQRMTSLAHTVESLKQSAARLPAQTEQEDRRLTAQVLGQTAAALTLLQGQNASGSLRQQLRIIGNTRSQLQTAAPDLNIEPATDSALRAIYNALVDLRDSHFAGVAQVTPPLTDLGQRLPELDHVRGPLHWLVVSQALWSAAETIDRMNRVLQARMAPTPSTAATQPALH